MDLTVACADMFKNKQIQTLLLMSLKNQERACIFGGIFVFQGMSLKYCFAPKTKETPIKHQLGVQRD